MKVIGFTGSEEGSFIKTWRTLGRMAADIEGLPAFSGGILALAPAVAPPPPSPPQPSLNPSGLEFMLAKPEWVGVYASSSAGGFVPPVRGFDLHRSVGLSFLSRVTGA